MVSNCQVIFVIHNLRYILRNILFQIFLIYCDDCTTWFLCHISFQVIYKVLYCDSNKHPSSNLQLVWLIYESQLEGQVLSKVFNPLWWLCCMSLIASHFLSSSSWDIIICQVIGRVYKIWHRKLDFTSKQNWIVPTLFPRWLMVSIYLPTSMGKKDQACVCARPYHLP